MPDPKLPPAHHVPTPRTGEPGGIEFDADAVAQVDAEESRKQLEREAESLERARREGKAR